MSSPAVVHGWLSATTASALGSGAAASIATWLVLLGGGAAYTARDGDERPWDRRFLALTLPWSLLAALLLVGVPVALFERLAVGSPLFAVGFLAAWSRAEVEGPAWDAVTGLVAVQFAPVVAGALGVLGLLEYWVRSTLSALDVVATAASPVAAALAMTITLLGLPVTAAVVGAPISELRADERTSLPLFLLIWLVLSVIALGTAVAMAVLAWLVAARWLATPVAVFFVALRAVIDITGDESPGGSDDEDDETVALRDLPGVLREFAVGVGVVICAVAALPTLELTLRRLVRTTPALQPRGRALLDVTGSLPVGLDQALALGTTAGAAGALGVLAIALAGRSLDEDVASVAGVRGGTLQWIVVWSLAFGAFVAIPTTAFAAARIWSPSLAVPVVLSPILGVLLADPTANPGRRGRYLAAALGGTLLLAIVEYGVLGLAAAV